MDGSIRPNLRNSSTEAIQGGYAVAVEMNTNQDNTQEDTDKLNKDGNPQDGQVFDEPQCVIVKRKQVPGGPRDTGGPKPLPKQHAAQRRSP